MKSKAIFGLFAFAVVAFGAAALFTQTAQAQVDPQGNKVTICHRNDAVKNRYVTESVDISAIDGGRHDDHSDHLGPVAYSEAVAQDLKDKHKMWGDIIPPFRNNGTPTGEDSLNWDTIGKAVWYAGCDTPHAASASVSVNPATCDMGEKLVYGAINNAAFSGTENGTTGLSDYNVTATADQDSLFFNVTPPTNTQVFTGTLAGHLTGEECEQEVKEARITATTACATVGGKMMIAVTIMNDGNADGTATVNGEPVNVAAGKSVVKYYASNTKVTVVVNDKTVLDETRVCEPGRGNETPSTPETPKTTPAVAVLPHTAGSMTQVLTIGALSVAGIILVAGASIKSRFLS